MLGSLTGGLNIRSVHIRYTYERLYMSDMYSRAVIFTADALNTSRSSVGVYGKSGVSVLSSKEMPNTIDMF